MAVVSSDSDADDQWGPSGVPSGVAAGNEDEGHVRGGGGVEPALESSPPSRQAATSGLTLTPDPPPPPPRPDRRVPRDFCVLQENLSADVEPERLDFLSVRRHWRQMEEEVKARMAAAGGRPLPRPGAAVSAGGSAVSSLRAPVGGAEPERGEGPEKGEGLLLAAFSPCSEDSGVEEPSGRSPYEEPENLNLVENLVENVVENAVEREIRQTLEREENFRRERRSQTAARTRPPPAPQPRPQGEEPRRASPVPRTPTFSLSPSPSPSPFPSPRPVYHEMTASNVIILEPDSASFPASPRRRPHGPPLLCPAPPSRFTDWPPSDAPSVIILETSNLIIRSASEFCLSGAGVAGAGGAGAGAGQESTFPSNPFFKLRSRSSVSLVEQEIRAVRQREEEWRRQREEEWRRQRAQLQTGGAGIRERYDTVLVSPSLLEGFGYEGTELPVRCVSSPSSPSRARRMDRSALSCDQRFPASLSSSSSSSATPRRQNAMAQRWEAGLIANHSQD